MLFVDANVTTQAVWNLDYDPPPFGGPAPLGQGLQIFASGAWHEPLGAGKGMAPNQVLTQYPVNVGPGDAWRTVAPVNVPVPPIPGGQSGLCI